MVAEKGFKPGESCSSEMSCGVNDLQLVAGKLSLVEVKGHTELDQIGPKVRALPGEGFYPSLELTISFRLDQGTKARGSLSSTTSLSQDRSR